MIVIVTIVTVIHMLPTCVGAPPKPSSYPIPTACYLHLLW